MLEYNQTFKVFILILKNTFNLSFWNENANETLSTFIEKDSQGMEMKYKNVTAHS